MKQQRRSGDVHPDILNTVINCRPKSWRQEQNAAHNNWDVIDKKKKGRVEI